MNRSEKWRIWSNKLICAALSLLGIYILLKYALGIIMPFIIAIVVALPVYELSKKSAIRLGGKQKCWSVFYVVTLWMMIFFVLLLFIRNVFAQAKDFFLYMSKNGEVLSGELEALVKKAIEMLSKIPILKNFVGNSVDKIGDEVQNTSSHLIKILADKGGAFAAESLGKFILKTPKALVSTVVCVMSSVYLAIDLEHIREYVFNVLSKKKTEKAKSLGRRILIGLKGYFKAYSLLFLINCIELFIGLTVMHRQYALFLAILLGFLDILPFFSTAVILVPWGIIMLVNGEYGIGIGMIVLALVMAVVRQIAEPRLVGKSLGIHPLASLASMYVGVRIFGFWGMMLAPVTVVVIKEFFEDRERNFTVEEQKR